MSLSAVFGLERILPLRQGPWALVSGVGLGIGLGAGLLLTGLGLWRVRVVPRSAAVCCALGPIALVAPGDLSWDAAPWLLVVVAFSSAAVALIAGVRAATPAAPQS
jgi:hypothetical protein